MAARKENPYLCVLASGERVMIHEGRLLKSDPHTKCVSIPTPADEAEVGNIVKRRRDAGWEIPCDEFMIEYLEMKREIGEADLRRFTPELRRSITELTDQEK